MLFHFLLSVGLIAQVALAQETWTKTTSGLLFRTLRRGSGANPLPRDSVQINYEGFFPNTGVVFDSSYQTGRSVTVNVDRLIKGASEAIQMMQVGGEYECRIPAALAYGTSGIRGVIPPNQDLAFRYELLAINPSVQLSAGDLGQPPRYDSVSGKAMCNPGLVQAVDPATSTVTCVSAKQTQPPAPTPPAPTARPALPTAQPTQPATARPTVRPTARPSVPTQPPQTLAEGSEGAVPRWTGVRFECDGQLVPKFDKANLRYVCSQYEAQSQAPTPEAPAPPAPPATSQSSAVAAALAQLALQQLAQTQAQQTQAQQTQAQQTAVQSVQVAPSYSFAAPQTRFAAPAVAQLPASLLAQAQQFQQQVRPVQQFTNYLPSYSYNNVGAFNAAPQVSAFYYYYY